MRAIPTLLLLGVLIVPAAALRSQELEPGVQTSSAAAAPKPAAASNAPAPGSALAPTAVSAAPATGAAKAAPNPVRPAASASAAPAPKGDKAVDRLELDTTQISGNRELPKVMYVVPWRRADLGDFAGRPPNSLLDEALAPVDRDVFKRQNHYYAQLAEQAASAKSQPEGAAGAAATPTTKDEK